MATLRDLYVGKSITPQRCFMAVNEWYMHNNARLNATINNMQLRSIVKGRLLVTLAT